MARYRMLALWLAGLVGFIGWAAASESYVDSVRFEGTARQIEQAIIAPCCWHQPVANHNSPVALEIRKEIRQKLRGGMTPDQIKADYVRRYGERILAVPPKNVFNRFLWIIPIAASITAFGVAGHLVRTWRRARSPSGKPSEPKAGSAASSVAFAKVDEELKKWDE